MSQSLLRLTPLRHLLHSRTKLLTTTTTTIRTAHTPTNTPQNTPTHTKSSGKSVTSEQSSTQSPSTPGDTASKKAKTGIINQGESSGYGNEQTKSGSHQEVVQENPNAAFDPNMTKPEQVKSSAGAEIVGEKITYERVKPQSGDSGNPLEYSGATPEVSQVKRDDRPVQGGKDRSKASGGSKRA